MTTGQRQGDIMILNHFGKFPLLTFQLSSLSRAKFELG